MYMQPLDHTGKPAFMGRLAASRPVQQQNAVGMRNARVQFTMGNLHRPPSPPSEERDQANTGAQSSVR